MFFPGKRMQVDQNHFVRQIELEKKNRMIGVACYAKTSDDAAKCRKPVICFKLFKDLPCSLTGSTSAMARRFTGFRAWFRTNLYICNIYIYSIYIYIYTYIYTWDVVGSLRMLLILQTWNSMDSMVATLGIAKQRRPRIVAVGSPGHQRHSPNHGRDSPTALQIRRSTCVLFF